MVKGISKRIIHIKAVPGDTFSEAFFVLKDETPGISEDEIVKEAISIAEKSGVKKSRISRKTLTNLCFGALGALFVSFFWVLSVL